MSFKVLLPTPNDDMKVIGWFLKHCEILEYNSHDIIFKEGDPADSIYYIIEGSVNIMITNCNENSVVLSNLAEHNFIGEMAFFLTEKQAYRTASAVARKHCRIAKISYENFKILTTHNVELLMKVGRQMARRLNFTSIHASNLSFLDVTGKITQTLLNIARKDDALTHPDGMQISITRQELGAMVGASRETVGRVLKILEDEDVICAKGKTIVVHLEKAEQFTYFRNDNSWGADKK